MLRCAARQGFQGSSLRFASRGEKEGEAATRCAHGAAAGVCWVAVRAALFGCHKPKHIYVKLVIFVGSMWALPKVVRIESVSFQSLLGTRISGILQDISRTLCTGQHNDAFRLCLLPRHEADAPFELPDALASQLCWRECRLYGRRNCRP